MAGQAGVEALQSARLLRVQRARELRARTEAAQAAAAREAARQALDAAVLRRHDAIRAVTLSARGRWDAALGTRLPASSLAMLRDTEAAERDGVRRLDDVAAEAEQALAEASRRAELAAAAATAQAAAGVRRERLAGRCAARLQRDLLRVEEAAAEDDLAGGEASKP